MNIKSHPYAFTQSVDDTILPFEVAALDLRGRSRLTRTGGRRDPCPARLSVPVSKLLGEAIALTALFSSVEIRWRLYHADAERWPVRMLVVD